MARSDGARSRWFPLLFLSSTALAVLSVGCTDPNPTFVFFVDAAPAPIDARDGGAIDLGAFGAPDGNEADAGDDADAGSPP